MGDFFVNDNFVPDKTNRAAEDNNPKAGDRQKHTGLITAIKATEREDMKYYQGKCWECRLVFLR